MGDKETFVARGGKALEPKETATRALLLAKPSHGGLDYRIFLAANSTIALALQLVRRDTIEVNDPIAVDIHAHCHIQNRSIDQHKELIHRGKSACVFSEEFCPRPSA